MSSDVEKDITQEANLFLTFNGHEVDWSNCQDCGGANNIIDVILGCKDRAHINGWHLWKENGNSRYIIFKYGKGETYLVSAIPNAVTYFLFIPERFHVTSGNSSLGICSDKRDKKMFESTTTNWSIFQWKQSIFKPISEGTVQAQMHLLRGRYRGCVQHGKGDILIFCGFSTQGMWGRLLPIPKLFFDKMQGLLVKLRQFY